MGDSADGGCGSREQTLLEAAKAWISLRDGFPSPGQWDLAAANLRTAIAREEARPPATTDGERRCWDGLVEGWRKGHDEQAARAQQAEADAKWHREESARLSAWLDATRSELQSLRTTLASAHSLPADTPTKELIGKFWETINGNAELLARTGHELPLKVSKVLPQVVDELLRLRDELEERREDGVVTAQDVCDLRARAMRAEAEAASVRLEFDAFAAKVLDQDLKAAMGAPHVGIVRDPVTGWTFDTMRQQFDAARTTVRVLAAELVAARQQIAGTKGFEA